MGRVMLVMMHLASPSYGWPIFPPRRLGVLTFCCCTSCRARTGAEIYRIPGGRRTRVERVPLANLGSTIILLAFYQTDVAQPRRSRSRTLVRLALLIVNVFSLFAVLLRVTFKSLYSVLSLYVFGVMGQADEKGEGRGVNCARSGWQSLLADGLQTFLRLSPTRAQRDGRGLSSTTTRDARLVPRAGHMH
jgi:hypothetical protein